MTRRGAAIEFVLTLLNTSVNNVFEKQLPLQTQMIMEPNEPGTYCTAHTQIFPTARARLRHASSKHPMPTRIGTSGPSGLLVPWSYIPDDPNSGAFWAYIQPK